MAVKDNVPLQPKRPPKKGKVDGGPGETYSRLLVKVVTSGHALEMAVGRLLAQAMRTPLETGLLVAARLGLSASIDLISELSKRRDYPFDRKAVAKWLPIAKGAVAARNLAIHSPWVINPHTQQYAAFIKRGVMLEKSSLTELDKMAALVYEAATGGLDLLKHAK